MNKKTTTKGKIKTTTHPFALKIDTKTFPRRKGNKAHSYAKKIIDDMEKLHDSEMRLNLTYENIRSHRKLISNRARAQRPVSYTTRIGYFKLIDEFDVEYENFCMRVYNYRETLRNFASEFLNIKAYAYKQFLEDSKIRDLGIDQIFEKFRKNNLKQITADRTNITHKVTEDQLKTTKKLSQKLEQQKDRSAAVTKAVIEITRIQDSVCVKISK